MIEYYWSNRKTFVKRNRLYLYLYKTSNRKPTEFKLDAHTYNNCIDICLYDQMFELKIQTYANHLFSSEEAFQYPYFLLIVDKWRRSCDVGESKLWLSGDLPNSWKKCPIFLVVRILTIVTETDKLRQAWWALEGTWIWSPDFALIHSLIPSTLLKHSNSPEITKNLLCQDESE